MIKSWTDKAWEEYLYWHARDKKIFKRINQLIEDIERNGNDGIGRPEPLKHEFSGLWGRRVDEEHRLVYKLTATELVILQCRSHYEQPRGRPDAYREGPRGLARLLIKIRSGWVYLSALFPEIKNRRVPVRILGSSEDAASVIF